MQPDFNNGGANPYNPWNLTTPPYHGISGGGDGGWGGEISVENHCYFNLAVAGVQE